MTPYPLDPVDATGPMRLVLGAFANRDDADAAIRRALDARLAACASSWPVRSRFWWRGKVESAEEVLVLFKTVPKRVGALFRAIAAHHPYEVPEIVELDVPRVHPPYLAYLAATIDRSAPPLPLGGGRPRRRGSPRARGARPPGRTRGRRRRP